MEKKKFLEKTSLDNKLYKITKENINLSITDQEMLMTFIEKLSQCSNVTVNIVFQSVGAITNSCVSLVNVNGSKNDIECKAKKELLP